MKPAVAIDAKATEHTLPRQGVGRLKHMDGACVCGVKMKAGSKN